MEKVQQRLMRAASALDAEGVPYAVARGNAARIDGFLDGPDAIARDAVHLLFAAEKVRDDSPESA